MRKYLRPATIVILLMLVNIISEALLYRCYPLYYLDFLITVFCSQVHWGQHPLRPEFLESTYFLHRATGDDHYLSVGKAALKSLQKHARVACGYAAMNDVRTRIHEDRMDSFVLAETFKYLYMLFADDSDIPINLDEFIMTTEAHLLPLTLADNRHNNKTIKEGSDDDHRLYPYSR